MFTYNIDHVKNKTKQKRKKSLNSDRTWNHTKYKIPQRNKSLMWSQSRDPGLFSSVYNPGTPYRVNPGTVNPDFGQIFVNIAQILAKIAQSFVKIAQLFVKIAQIL
jgi:hypothetical protein